MHLAVTILIRFVFIDITVNYYAEYSVFILQTKNDTKVFPPTEHCTWHLKVFDSGL